MVKRYIKRSCVFALLIAPVYFVSAQLPQRNSTSPQAKQKAPIAKTSLGKLTGKQISATAEEAKQYIAQQLKITDDKNVEYVISSYQLAYRRIGITEDEATGKTSPQTDMVAQRFTATPLPAVWISNIVEGLHSGEELYFFDIIAFDRQGRRFFAPELKISIL